LQIEYLIHIIILSISLIIAFIISSFASNIIKNNFIIKYFYKIPPKNFGQVLDENGIPLVYYSMEDDGKLIGYQRNPVYTAMQANKFYDAYKKNKNNTLKKYFLNNADWLVANAIEKENYSLLPYVFPLPIYNLKPTWYSAMANGLALEVLTKAHEITRDSKYLTSAKNLLNAFFINVEDGGIRYKDSADKWWYEEYSSNKKNIKVSRVLNGMMYALLGIDYYFKYTKDSDAKLLFNNGVNCTKEEISKYDNHGYSYYDIIGNPAGKYHKIHINQSKQLYDLTGEQIFDDYHKLWKKYNPPVKIPIPGRKTFFGSLMLLIAIIETSYFIISFS